MARKTTGRARTVSQKEAAKPAPKGARIQLLILAAMLILAGIFNGGLRDVLVKAINICTECIGLG